MFDRNPYEAPRTEVGDIATQSAPGQVARRLPRLTLGAGVLATAGLLLAAVHVSLFVDWHGNLSRFISGSLYVFLAWFAISSVRKARNWVRWTMVALGVWSLAGLLWGLPEGTRLLVRAIHFTQELLLGSAAILFLLPSSGRWFARDTHA